MSWFGYGSCDNAREHQRDGERHADRGWADTFNHSRYGGECDRAYFDAYDSRARENERREEEEREERERHDRCAAAARRRREEEEYERACDEEWERHCNEERYGDAGMYGPPRRVRGRPTSAKQRRAAVRAAKMEIPW